QKLSSRVHSAEGNTLSDSVSRQSVEQLRQISPNGLECIPVPTPCRPREPIREEDVVTEGAAEHTRPALSVDGSGPEAGVGAGRGGGGAPPAARRRHRRRVREGRNQFQTRLTSETAPAPPACTA